MKKEYIAPCIFCMTITTNTFVCGSLRETLVTDESETITEDNQMLSRSINVWGEDE